MKQILKQLLYDAKRKVNYLKYKDVLPNNPMHDDIYIVEFPKSGITWLQHILGNIELGLADKKESITFYNHHKYMPDVHQLRGMHVHRVLERTFIKSHAEYNPYYYFVIYLVRNPFDVMVSYYNFMCSHGYKNSFNDFVRSESYGVLNWKAHLKSWNYKKVIAQRIHFIRYEDLIENPFKEVLNLYVNLGVEISEKAIEKAIEKSCLANMSKSESHYKVYNPNYNMSFVGKSGKKRRSDIMTKEIEDYIFDSCFEEIKYFYSDLLLK